MNRTTTGVRRWYAAPLALVALLGLLLQGCGSAAQSGLAVGDPAPDFTLPNALGGEVSLASYQGQQPALLYFHMALG
jgi:hypothetical protein